MSLQKLIKQLKKENIMDYHDNPKALNYGRDFKVTSFSPNDNSVCARFYNNSHKAAADYETIKYLNNIIPKYIVKLLGLWKSGDNSVVVTRYIENDPFTINNLSSSILCGEISDFLLCLNAVTTTGVKNEEVKITNILKYLDNTDLENKEVASDYIGNHVNKLLDFLPSIPQHGDFTFTNLGVTSSRNIVVFDWEDYGCVRYPGFDLVTFVLSVLHHSGKLENIIHLPKKVLDITYELFDQGLIERIFLRDNIYLTLFPYYLLVFAYIKRKYRYSKKIEDRAKNAFNKILNGSEWNEVLLFK